MKQWPRDERQHIALATARRRVPDQDAIVGGIQLIEAEERRLQSGLADKLGGTFVAVPLHNCAIDEVDARDGQSGLRAGRAQAQAVAQQAQQAGHLLNMTIAERIAASPSVLVQDLPRLLYREQ